MWPHLTCRLYRLALQRKNVRRYPRPLRVTFNVVTCRRFNGLHHRLLHVHRPCLFNRAIHDRARVTARRIFRTSGSLRLLRTFLTVRILLIVNSSAPCHGIRPTSISNFHSEKGFSTRRRPLMVGHLIYVHGLICHLISNFKDPTLSSVTRPSFKVICHVSSRRPLHALPRNFSRLIVKSNRLIIFKRCQNGAIILRIMGTSLFNVNLSRELT